MSNMKFTRQWIWYETGAFNDEIQDQDIKIYPREEDMFADLRSVRREFRDAKYLAHRTKQGEARMHSFGEFRADGVVTFEIVLQPVYVSHAEELVLIDGQPKIVRRH